MTEGQEPTGAENPSRGRDVAAVVAGEAAGKAMQERSARGAALTRALQGESMATRAPVAPVGVVGLGVATVLLLLSNSIISLGVTAQGNDAGLRDGCLAIVLGMTAFWWYGVGPQARGPAVLSALCAAFLVAVAAGLFDAPRGVRTMDALIAGLVILSTVLRAIGPTRPEGP